MLDKVKELPYKVNQFLQCSSGDLLDAATSVSSEVIPFVGAIKPVVDSVDHMKFSYLLVGLKGSDNLGEKINQVYDYVSSPNRAEYVATLFRQALINTSRIANAMMGIQLSKLSGSDSELTQLDMVVYDALTSFNDYDIKNFKVIYELTKAKPLKTSEGLCINEDMLKEVANYAQLQMTISKSYRIGLLNYLPSVYIDGSASDDGMGTLAMGSYYMLNDASDCFYQLICEVDALLEK